MKRGSGFILILAAGLFLWTGCGSNPAKNADDDIRSIEGIWSNRYMVQLAEIGPETGQTVGGEYQSHLYLLSDSFNLRIFDVDSVMQKEVAGCIHIDGDTLIFHASYQLLGSDPRVVPRGETVVDFEEWLGMEFTAEDTLYLNCMIPPGGSGQQVISSPGFLWSLPNLGAAVIITDSCFFRIKDFSK